MSDAFFLFKAKQRPISNQLSSETIRFTCSSTSAEITLVLFLFWPMRDWNVEK